MMADMYADCTENCERRVRCADCGMTKSPLGRDPGMDNGLCGVDCPGYYKVPTPGHLWPGELRRIREDEGPNANPTH